MCKKTSFVTFDLEYLKIPARDLLWFLRKVLEHQNKGVFTFYLTFPGDITNTELKY